MSMVPNSANKIEATIRYLTTAEGGRQNGVVSGYRGQFYYNGNDHDGSQVFPGLPEGVFAELGTSLQVIIHFPEKRWNEIHSKHIEVGMPFEIHEGSRVVGHGTVTKIL